MEVANGSRVDLIGVILIYTVSDFHQGKLGGERQTATITLRATMVGSIVIFCLA